MIKKTMTWKSMQSHLNGLQISKKIMEDYVELGSYEKLAEVYNAPMTTIRDFIDRWDNLVSKAYPKLYAAFENRKYERRTKAPIEEKGSVDKGLFKNIPKQIKYNDFIDKMLERNTKEFSVNKLLESAQKQGIKVIN